MIWHSFYNHARGFYLLLEMFDFLFKIFYDKLMFQFLAPTPSIILKLCHHHDQTNISESKIENCKYVNIWVNYGYTV